MSDRTGTVAEGAAFVPPPLDPQARSFGFLRATVALILREMSTRYGRTPGGYIWALLEPLGVIVILSIAFALMLRTPSLGSSFLLFYASGYLPFTLFLSVSGAVAQALNFSKPLLAYPSVTWLDAIVARFALNTLTSALVSYILLTGILVTADTRAVLDLPPMILAMSLSALLALGIGTMNCLLISLFPTWGMIWRIATRPLFLMSGIFFTYEDMPQVAQEILWYNPLLHLTGLMRTGIYPMYHPQYISLSYVLVVTFVLLVMGLLLLRRYHLHLLSR